MCRSGVVHCLRLPGSYRTAAGYKRYYVSKRALRFTSVAMRLSVFARAAGNCTKVINAVIKCDAHGR